MFRTHRLAAGALLTFISLAAVQAQTTAPAAPAAAAAPTAASADTSEGKLAYYGNKFAGRRTASGETFDPAALTMAHKTLPFGTKVRVTNLANQRSVVVRVNDRGPTQADRVGDVSPAAARALRMTRAGVITAKLDVVGTARTSKRVGKA